MPTAGWLRRIRRPPVMWALTAFVVEFVVDRVLGGGSVPPGGVRVALALAPLLPSLLFMVALVRMVQRMDEMQQRICLESVFIAFICSLALTFVFAGLDQAGVYHPPWDVIGESMLVFWGCAYVYSGWKYR
jgi:peptidoglycan biosynthesis protein MviN/MurJ (putative lipid II flippase)